MIEFSCNGYVVYQCDDNKILIFNKEGKEVYKAVCTKKMTEDELKGYVAMLERSRKEYDS